MRHSNPVVIDRVLFTRLEVSLNQKRRNSMTTKAKKIRARFGLGKLSDGDVQHLLDGSLKGLTDNAAIFPKPPLELSAYQSAIAAFDAAIPAALDGSKTAIAHKNKLRDAAVRMYVQLAHYVEANCNDDLTTFLLSGFQPAASIKTPPGAARSAGDRFCCAGATHRATEDQGNFRSQSKELPHPLGRPSERWRPACVMDGGTHLHGDVHDHQQSDARNHLHVPGPRVGTAGIHQLE